MNDKHDKTNLAIEKMRQIKEKPVLFAAGDAKFWIDPHISKQLLGIHLDPTTDAASRPPHIIYKTIDWIIHTLELHKNDRVLDLGCGPGLYATYLAKKGMKVTGVDFSKNSIEYAIQDAQRNALSIVYRCQDYLEIDDATEFDVALLIYGDLCALDPDSRTRLFANVHHALKPGGFFVLDVTTPLLHRRKGLKNRWYAAHNDFWRSGWHIVLEQGFEYEENVFLNQYVIIDENNTITIYRNWFQDYTAESIRKEIECNGFFVESMWSDLIGTPYDSKSEWIGIVARKPLK